MNIQFPFDHENPTDSQLLIAITGKPLQIKEALRRLLGEMEEDYSKPAQGTRIEYRGVTTVITPKWSGKNY